MQDIIEEAIRLIGRGLLAVVTFGSYRPSARAPRDRLVEGSLGLAIVAGLLWVGYRLAAG